MILILLLIKFFDQHTNMILSDVEEIHTNVEFNQDTLEEIVKVCGDYQFLYFKNF